MDKDIIDMLELLAEAFDLDNEGQLVKSDTEESKYLISVVEASYEIEQMLASTELADNLRKVIEILKDK